MKTEARSGWRKVGMAARVRLVNFEDLRVYYFQQLERQVQSIAGELTQLRFASQVPIGAWHPPVNAYRCETCILIVTELAGVEQKEISVTVESRRVRVGGRRALPEPRPVEGPALQVLAMEIDYGAFEREIVLPAKVDPQRVTAEQREGLLWINLPLADENGPS